MCGIAGFFGAHSRSLLEDMNDALGHRGPDGGDVETDVASIGMRRLKITRAVQPEIAAAA